MPTLLQLSQGARQVLPTSLDTSKLRDLSLVSMNVASFEGTGLKQFNSIVRSSTGNKHYSTRIWFIVKDRPVSRYLPSISNDNVLVRCSCDAYFFWAVYANAAVRSQISGTRFRHYHRKTPLPPDGYPQKNPSNIPCICKHLVFLSQYLRMRQEII